MAVNLEQPSQLLPIQGTRWLTADAAVKTPGSDDLALLLLEEGATAAGVFTRNAFAAAPVVVSRRHLQMTSPRALVVNSGNANAGTGSQGEADALACCRQIAARCQLTEEQILPFSTGVIGQRLPMARLESAIDGMLQQNTEQDWLTAARAIMTTDTVAKGCSREVEVDGQPIRLTGIAKGSGMIRPDMATMLAFVATDAAVSTEDLHQLLLQATQESFNCITVDGDTSTNDSTLLCATGASGVTLGAEHPAWEAFVEAVTDIMQTLACAIVRDAEGATRFITLQVEGATSEEEARAVAFTVAHSPLFKTAAFAGDPNWGRILAAVGRAPVSDLAVDRVSIMLDEVRIVHQGQPDPAYREEDGTRVMAASEFVVGIDLGRGSARTSVWTSDLSHDYIRINAEYRS